MKARFIRVLTVFGFACLLIADSAGLASEKQGDEGTTLNHYEINFYGETTGARPDKIIKLENNGEILLACRSGKSRDELREQGITVSNSQIELLIRNRLLELENKALKTTFPILTPDKTELLRAITTEEGYKMGHKIHKELKALKEKLLPDRRLNTHYTILYSYVLNDLVFRLFKDRGLIEDTKITAKEPTWRGLVWAVYPPREFSCWTRTISYKGIDFRIIGSEESLPKLEPLIENRKSITDLIDDYIKKGKIKDGPARRALEPYNLFDESGDITLPVIVEKRGEPLYEKCMPLAKKVSKYVTEAIDLQGIGEELDIWDEGQVLLIVYHELMWDMMEYLEAQGLTQKPEVFAFPERAQQEDMGDLVFLVSKERIRRR